MTHRVLLVATDAAELCGQLSRCGVTVRAVPSVDGALPALQEHAIDLVVLHPDGDRAKSACRELRALSTAPLLVVLDTQHEEQYVVSVLEAGADSVLVAPVSRRELAARVAALCRLQRAAQPERIRHRVYRDGQLVVDPDGHTVSREGRTLSLTPTEFRLLVALTRRSGQVATHGELLAEVWGQGHAVGPDHLRPHIRCLRRKLGDSDGTPRLVVNQRGVGYRFAPGAMNLKGTEVYAGE